MPSNNGRWIGILSRAASEPYSSVLLIGFVYIFIIIYNSLIWIIARNVIDLGFRLNAKIFITIISVAYLFIGIHHLTDRVKTAFSALEGNSGSEGLIDKFKANFNRVMVHSKAQYALTATIILSYVFLPPPDKSDFLYFSLNEGPWIVRLLLDIISWSSTLVILYLMSEALWITICVSWALGQIKETFREAVKIDLYSGDNVGGLGPIRNLILFLALFQFGSISLALVNFSEEDKYNITVIFFIAIFLFNVYLFLKGWFVIDDLMEVERVHEFDIINRIYSQKKQLLLDALTNDNIRIKTNTDELPKSMDILSSERERLSKASKTVYDYKAIFAFITSSLLPFIIQYIIPIKKI